ncbi:9786_t:CDS:1, partial [Cetraspora pellucida]
PPNNVLGCHYDPQNLPLRTHESYLLDATTIGYLNGSSRKREIQDRGKLSI